MSLYLAIFGIFMPETGFLYPKKENEWKMLFEFSFRKIGHGFPRNSERKRRRNEEKPHETDHRIAQFLSNFVHS